MKGGAVLGQTQLDQIARRRRSSPGRSTRLQLARDPRNTSLLDIVLAIDGPAHAFRCTEIFRAVRPQSNRLPVGIRSGTASCGQQVGNVVGLAVMVAVAGNSSLRPNLLSAAGVLLTAVIARTGPRSLALGN